MESRHRDFTVTAFYFAHQSGTGDLNRTFPPGFQLENSGFNTFRVVGTK